MVLIFVTLICSITVSQIIFKLDNFINIGSIQHIIKNVTSMSSENLLKNQINLQEEIKFMSGSSLKTNFRVI